MKDKELPLVTEEIGFRRYGWFSPAVRRLQPWLTLWYEDLDGKRVKVNCVSSKPSQPAWCGQGAIKRGELNKFLEVYQGNGNVA